MTNVKIELLVIKSNPYNHFTVCKQMINIELKY